MVSRSEMRKFLGKEGILVLPKPKAVSVEEIAKKVERKGYALTKKGIKQLQKHVPLMKSEGIEGLVILGEKWRKRKELKIVTLPKGISRSHYEFYVPIKKRKR